MVRLKHKSARILQYEINNTSDGSRKNVSYVMGQVMVTLVVMVVVEVMMMMAVLMDL
jgi:hypothetical protein